MALRTSILVDADADAAAAAEETLLLLLATTTTTIASKNERSAITDVRMIITGRICPAKTSWTSTVAAEANAEATAAMLLL